MKARTEKDMSVVRRIQPFDAALRKGITFGHLKNYKLNGNRVTLHWNLNAVAERDKIFSVTIGGQEAYIDLEELLSYTRLM